MQRLCNLSTKTHTARVSQITDYYAIHKGHYNVKDLYRANRDVWYWYTYGINFRSVPLAPWGRSF